MSTHVCAKESKPQIRCAIYTRKSTDEGLEQEYNSLDAQREAAEAYIASQKHEGWVALSKKYDDGGFTGANMDRPALKRLLRDVEDGKIDSIIVYKVGRLSRSLLDFAKIIETLDSHGVSFVSVTQQFNTTTPMGRLTLNILLSFAQFEREIISERVRDKIAGAKRKGKFTGGTPTYGYDIDYEKHKLVINEREAKVVKHIFRLFTETHSGLTVSKELNAKGITTKSWTTRNGKFHSGKKWNASLVYRMLNNRLYLGKMAYKDGVYRGEHKAIISQTLWKKAHSIISSGAGPRIYNKTHSLLEGIVRCGHCNRSMTSIYTKRRDNIYHYYLCTGAAKDGYDSCLLKTVSSGRLEEAVTNQIRSTLRSPDTVTHILGSDADPVVIWGTHDMLAKVDSEWDAISPAEQKRLIISLVREIIVYKDSLALEIRAAGLQVIANIESFDADDFQLSIPVEMKKRSGQKEIILPGGATSRVLCKHSAVAIALARAYCWLELLESGKYRSINDMSQKLGICSAYMARIMRLTLLAPDIAEAIVYGRKPDGLSLNKFVKSIPKNWHEQRILYGFAEKPDL
ncbi:MAG: recombinase family protein [Armatimonadota bacterium]|nr:recombinase family protein [bacterium]